MQNHRVPSFFLTRMMGLGHGLDEGCITPISCSSCNWRAISFRTPNGTQHKCCFLGGASPVWISICMRSISPLSLSSTAKTLWWSLRHWWSCSHSEVERQTSSFGRRVNSLLTRSAAVLIPQTEDSGKTAVVVVCKTGMESRFDHNSCCHSG